MSKKSKKSTNKRKTQQKNNVSVTDEAQEIARKLIATPTTDRQYEFTKQTTSSKAIKKTHYSTQRFIWAAVALLVVLSIIIVVTLKDPASAPSSSPTTTLKVLPNNNGLPSQADNVTLQQNQQSGGQPSSLQPAGTLSREELQNIQETGQIKQ